MFKLIGLLYSHNPTRFIFNLLIAPLALIYLSLHYPYFVIGVLFVTMIVNTVANLTKLTQDEVQKKYFGFTSDELSHMVIKKTIDEMNEKKS